MIEKEETRESVAAQIAELKKKYRSMPPPRCDSQAQPEFVSSTSYEACIQEDPIEFMKQGSDSFNTSTVLFRNASIQELEGCLRFFNGKSQSSKKRRLLTLLRRAPNIRTSNFKLLEQRLYIIKNWMRENNVTCPLEDLPLTVQN